jgi:L-fuculose-phosphate aldolase
MNDYREEIAYYMKRLYERGLTTTCGGNISLRSENGSILITPSGPDKGRLTADMICEVSLDDGTLLSGSTPSMETALHLKVMRARPDVNAVIHAHPTFASAFSATGRKIESGLTGETRLVLGKIGSVPYARMGSEELASLVKEAARDSNVLLMANHGPICLGVSLGEAFNRIEVLEQAARITLITTMLGGRNELGAIELEAIDRLFGGQ